MTKRFPPPPPFGAPLSGARPSAEARSLLALRRSANKLLISAPGPAPDELDEMLRVAMRVPDHHRLTPWRFIVIEGDARTELSEALASIQQSRGAPEMQVEAARQSMQRAPVVVAVVSAPVDDGRTPEWEQELSAGAVCYNLLLAANASGWAGVWLTEWMAYDQDAAVLLGLKDKERFAGFVHIGTSRIATPERARPEPAEKIIRWKSV